MRRLDLGFSSFPCFFLQHVTCATRDVAGGSAVALLTSQGGCYGYWSIPVCCVHIDSHGMHSDLGCRICAVARQSCFSMQAIHGPDRTYRLIWPTHDTRCRDGGSCYKCGLRFGLAAPDLIPDLGARYYSEANSQDPATICTPRRWATTAVATPGVTRTDGDTGAGW